MSIYLLSKDDLAAMVAAKAGVTITSADFTVLAVKPTTNGESTHNTKAMLRFATTSAYKGDLKVYYDRLDLSQIANFSPFSVNGIRKAPAYTGDALYDILPQVRDAIGIQFSSEGLEATVVTDGTYGSEVLLKAKADAIGFIGQYTLRLSGYPNIGKLFYSTSMPGF